MSELLSPIEKLDKVLAIFNPETNQKPELDRKSIKMMLDSQDIIIDDRQLFEILTKLAKDGYLRADSDNRTANVYGKIVDAIYYSLTFEGELFLKNKGYGAKFLADQADADADKHEKQRIARLEQANADAQKRLNQLTTLLVWGSWIAGIGTGFLALIELWKLISPFFCYDN